MVHFLSLLPADHVVRTETKQAVQLRLNQNPIVEGIPSTVAIAREWFAASSWLGVPGNIGDPLALTGLNASERKSICAMLSINENGSVANVVNRILTTVKVRSGATPFIDVMHIVAPDKLRELNDTSAANLRINLAGTPLESAAAGREGADLRDIASMAWWLFNCCNSGTDVTALAEAARNKIWDIFGIQVAWDDRTKHAALESMLKLWHERVDRQLPAPPPPPPPQSRAAEDDPIIIPDPSIAANRVVPTITRAAMLAWSQGRQAAVSNWWDGRPNPRGAGAQLPPEATNLGRAQLGSGGPDGSSAFAPLLAGGYKEIYALALTVAEKSQFMGPTEGVAATVMDLLQKHILLFRDPYQLMSQEQSDALKAKRKAGNLSATPPFSSFPHLQPVALIPGGVLDMVLVGAMVRFAIHADSSLCDDYTTQTRRTARQQALDNLAVAFNASLTSGDLMGFYHAKDSLRRMVLTSSDENRASAFADFN